jgi:hypothetical protein
MKQSKLLIGIVHGSPRQPLDKKWIKQCESELEGVRLSKPDLKVGLELPEDYLEREKQGMKVLVFSEIAGFCRKNGIAVFPLNDPDVKRQMHALIGAKNMLKKGVFTETVLREELMSLRDSLRYSPPEMFAEKEYWMDLYQRALAILLELRDTSSDAAILKQLRNKFDITVDTMDQYAIEIIQRYNLDVIIVGVSHTVRLLSALPDYKRMLFPPDVDMSPASLREDDLWTL